MAGSDSGRSTSAWMDEGMSEYPALEANANADVCVVGGGIAGLSTAYLLSREGKKVILLDDGPIGGGETGRTTAHLSNAVDDRYTRIEWLHGEEGARICADSHTTAIDTIESIVNDQVIDCDFVRLDGYLFGGGDETSVTLDEERAAAHRAGLVDVELLDRAPLRSFNTGPCLRFPRQGQFHPLKYLRGLAAAFIRNGGRICTSTHVDAVEGGDGAHVTTRSGAIVVAGAVVVATNSPINDMFVIHTKQAPYRSYVIGARVPRGSVEHGLYWDMLDPYHYVRLAPEADDDHDLLIVGGEDTKTGHEGDDRERFDQLEAWGRERFPMIEQIGFRWSGQVMEPVDGVAFIGRNPADDPNIYVATGDSGMGMTHGTIAGLLITDLIVGRENPWTSLYDPSRITLKAAGEFVREGADVVAKLGAWVTGGDVESADEIAADSGAIIRRGLGKIAVYRDASGQLHERSAACPHLGCVVAWNPIEKSWDCPCHGSRFDPYGRVLNGPAASELKDLGKQE